MADNPQEPGTQDPNPAPPAAPASQPPASPPPSGNLPTKPGDASGSTPPAKPTEDGGANNKQQPKSVFEGVDPKLIGALKSALTKEIKDKVKADLETEQAQKEGKWEELYRKAEPKLERIPALEAELESYKGIVTKTLNDRIKDWPKEWLDGDPRKRNPDASLDDVVAWMDWAEPLVKPVDKKPPANVNGGAPAGQGQGQGNVGAGGMINASQVPAGWTPEEWAKYKANAKQKYGASI